MTPALHGPVGRDRGAEPARGRAGIHRARGDGCPPV